MKTIPQVREELLELAETIRNPKVSKKIKSLVKHMVRRSPVRRSPNRSQPMTKDLSNRIRRVALANPTLDYMQLAKGFRVATGRISEAIAGKRVA